MSRVVEFSRRWAERIGLRVSRDVVYDYPDIAQRVRGKWYFFSNAQVASPFYLLTPLEVSTVHLWRWTLTWPTDWDKMVLVRDCILNHK